MALKFLNKKGWHTGSLRNIENVWKAEQKHDAEQKKLDELRKQIVEEREHAEFRLLQEQAGFVPKQERLDFLYDSGLAVGKGSSSDGFKTLEALPKTETDTTSSSKQQASAPGALFEEKPQSANDAWRKLHSDPLLLIRQREQEALARVKNNPVQMAMIHKSMEAKKKDKEEKHESREHKKKLYHESSKREKYSSSKAHFSSEAASSEGEEREERRKSSHRKNSKHEHVSKGRSNSEATPSETERRKKSHSKNLKHEERPHKVQLDAETATSEGKERSKRSHHKSKRAKHSPQGRSDSEAATREREYRSHHQAGHRHVLDPIRGSESNHAGSESSAAALLNGSSHKHRQTTLKLSQEERAARLREMQMDAELHEEQRWKRLKKASEDDAREATQVGSSSGRNFLDAAQRSVYGADKGGSSTIEESVRRRTHYLQGKSEAREGNAFRR